MTEDFQILLRNLIIMLRVSENAKWHTKFNFFLIVKGLLTKFSKDVFQNFNKSLPGFITVLEDEPRIVLTEILEILLPLYLE